MPSEKPARRLRDILENADAVARYTEGMEMGAFYADAKTRDAVEPAWNASARPLASWASKRRSWWAIDLGRKSQPSADVPDSGCPGLA